MSATAWDTSCRDWEERIVAGGSLIPTLPLYTRRAHHAVEIFKRLRLVKVRGEPTMAEACDPWVFAYVAAIFGGYDPETQRQIIRQSLLLIAKKNGKSSIAAGIMLTALIMNTIRQGEYTILAPTKEIADNSFDAAYGMVQADVGLARRYKPSAITREIINRTDGAALRVKAADAESVGGQNSIAVLVDELWLLGKKASAENMLSEATGSLVTQPEGFVLYLSTQSDERPAGVFLKLLRYFRKVRDGEIVDPTALPVLYEYPDDMAQSGQWRNPETWKIPNPSLGRGVDLRELQSLFAKAQVDGADSVKLFCAKHLNIEIGVGLKTDGWAGAEQWERASEPGFCRDLDNLLGRSEVAVIGIDGGGLDDLLALVVIGRERSTGRWLVWGHAWAHEIVLERRKSEAPRLLDLCAAGEIELVDLIDQVEGVADVCDQVRASGLLPVRHGIGIDPHAVGQISTALAQRGLTEDSGMVVGVTQGYKLSGAIQTAERKLADRSMVHGGQALMAWAVGNAKIEAKGNALLVTKAASGRAKIDPIMALFNAVTLMSLSPPARRSVYEDRRMLVV